MTVSNLTSYSATINWTAGDAAATMVFYGLSSSYGLQTVEDPTLRTGRAAILQQNRLFGPMHRCRIEQSGI